MSGPPTPDPDPCPQPPIDDAKPLIGGCLIAAIAVSVLFFAFALGAYSTWREQSTHIEDMEQDEPITPASAPNE